MDICNNDNKYIYINVNSIVYLFIRLVKENMLYIRGLNKSNVV